MAGWLPESAEGITELDGAFGLRPALYTRYRDFVTRLWSPSVLDPVLTELVRLRIAGLHACPVEQAARTRAAVHAGLTETRIDRLAHGSGDAAFSPVESACLLFAELFVLAPGMITDDDRARLAGLLGDAGVAGLAMVCAAYDGFDRFRIVLGIHETDPELPYPMLVHPCGLDPEAPAGPAGHVPACPVAATPLARQPELLASYLRMCATLWWDGVVDHPAKEVARLRSARVTGCRYCRNIRFAQARADGLDEDQVALIADGFELSRLAERHKVVIRFADFFLADPHGAAEERAAGLRADLVAAYGPDGTVELAAGLAIFLGFSKTAVALGTVRSDFPTMVIPTPRG
ncbi:carboxymuconolactone decarboxylase family protein [Yinghuangia sp. ASG 101]|uniref:carboxymuconolactone decarboxylase family protein n=1 Tax=Yinghuangia sp. ASG 101 TaxID=2896848 RepID=UPI001E60B862|nr:carboxymuconolactone decarboxylase family protein [Yinghuangia sp. ASG 101]UGQ10607.1 carboxymuconolactone decarboxylase family protein [Yinghuangia sp. ASG 101]